MKILHKKKQGRQSPASREMRDTEIGAKIS